MPTVLDHALFVLLAAAWPLYGLLRHGPAMRRIESGVAGARAQAYRRTIAEEWLVALLVVALWLGTGRSWSALGLGGGTCGWFWAALGLVAAATAFACAQVAAVARRADLRAQVRTQRVSSSAGSISSRARSGSRSSCTRSSI